MIVMKNFFFSVLFLYCLNSFGQNEDKVWYFGASGAGIDFRDCSPIVKTNGNNASSALEGAVSICDASTGRLLFYSSEAKIIDSTFNVMPSGLNVGNGTSGTQSTIVRKPGSSTIFYYIVTDIQGGTIPSFSTSAKGLSYAIIDMSLNGGLGDVVSSHNPIKDTSNCEKLTTIKHANGTDVWLIAHEYNNNKFLVYLIDNTGINLTPAIYNVGPSITALQSTTYASSRFDAIGELKASPDGNKIAFTTLYNGITCLFDFDKSTGIISNPLSLNLNGFGGYGVSFSSDNQKLYISCVDTTDFNSPVNSEIVQFDLSSSIPAIIQGSKVVINFCSTCSYRSLKLAPNGKIYCAKIPTIPESEYLAVINNPNNSGISCNYVHNGIYLNGKYGSWGLNNIMESNNYCLETQGIQDQALFSLVELSFDNLTSSLNFNCKIKNAELRLFDLGGKIIKQTNLDLGVSKLDIKAIQNGIYIATIFIDNAPTTNLKFLKN